MSALMAGVIGRPPTTGDACAIVGVPFIFTPELAGAM